jgi:phosphoribosylamine--glycine ligase
VRILIVGSGGREHALAWKVAQSPRVQRVFVAPGNAGTACEPKVRNVPLNVGELARLADFARSQFVDLTIVGPELPLVAGLADLFRAQGLRCFGPSRAAARLEGSKVFAKDFMVRHGIPTASSRTFTDLSQALAYVQSHPTPLVVKADGLAGGKGVVVAQNREQAETAVRDMLAGEVFGEAGQRILVEEYLVGEEASFIAMVDGRNVLPFAGSQDHKTRDDGDRGPNTGGMGAYSPAPVLTEPVQERVLRTIVEPVVCGMVAEGHAYSGFLYAGLMIDPEGLPRVLEFNCRLGDPEAQPLLMRLRSDLVDLCQAGCSGSLSDVQARWDPRTAVGVVMAAAGYPETYRKGDIVHGLPEHEVPDAKVFHAGTAEEQGNIVTDGGRVLCAVALGTDAAEAQARAYRLVRQIHWDGVYYRSDIGHRAIARAVARE